MIFMQGVQNHQNSGDGRPPPPPMTPTALFGSDQGDNRWAPTAPPVPTTTNHHHHHQDANSGNKEPVWLRFRRSRGL